MGIEMLSQEIGSCILQGEEDIGRGRKKRKHKKIGEEGNSKRVERKG